MQRFELVIDLLPCIVWTCSYWKPPEAVTLTQLQYDMFVAQCWIYVCMWNWMDNRWLGSQAVPEALSVVHHVPLLRLNCEVDCCCSCWCPALLSASHNVDWMACKKREWFPAWYGHFGLLNGCCWLSLFIDNGTVTVWKGCMVSCTRVSVRCRLLPEFRWPKTKQQTNFSVFFDWALRVTEMECSRCL